MNQGESAVGITAIAEILNVSRSTAYSRAVNVAEREPDRGEIPGFKIGNRWRFFPSQVAEHLSKPVDPWAYLPAAKPKLRRVP